MMKKTTLMIALAAMTSLNLFAAEPQTILPCPENAPLKWRMEGAAKVLEDGSVELVSSGMAERPGAIRWMPLRSGEKYVFTAEFKGTSGNLIIGLFNVAGKLNVRNVRMTKLD